MKNLIFQYWNGRVNNCAKESKKTMEKYAAKIGAEYYFAENANWSKTHGAYYDAFRPVYDDMFLEYDNVLYLDMDVFAMDGFEDNIFDEQVEYVGICEEMLQPWIRETMTVGGCINAKNDELWEQCLQQLTPLKLPRDSKGRHRIFNSGVVLYTNAGLRKCREKFIPFADYVNTVARAGLGRFYQLDQNYLNCNLFNGTIEPTIIDNRFNAQIHYIRGDKPGINDERKGRKCLVHMQLSGSNDWDAQQLWEKVNMPVSLWK